MNRRMLWQRGCALGAGLMVGIGLLTGCGGRIVDGTEGRDPDTPLSVVCTIFPAYDWARQITAGTDTELTYLLESGADMHSFQPSAQDMVAIADCDVFICVGGESDAWVDDALKSGKNDSRQVIRMLEVVGSDARVEEEKEGMEPEAEEEEGVLDEHVWLSLRQAQHICMAMLDVFQASDQKNADTYQTNLTNYLDQLGTLDAQYTKLCQSAPQNTLIFGDRFAFRYFVEDYHLDYYAAFAGCSAETEASFETIAFLAKKADETGVSTIFTQEKSDGRIAQAVVENTAQKNQTIAALDTLQAVSAQDIEAGKTYLKGMQENYTILEKALKA